jgi:hypothetical protein
LPIRIEKGKKTMETQTPQTMAEKPEIDSKKLYTTPILKDYGKVVTLTLGPSSPGKGNKPSDGANGPHHP